MSDFSNDTFSPAAPELGIYPNRWIPLKEQNRQLKQDLQTKEEELTYLFEEYHLATHARKIHQGSFLPPFSRKYEQNAFAIDLCLYDENNT